MIGRLCDGHEADHTGSTRTQQGYGATCSTWRRAARYRPDAVGVLTMNGPAELAGYTGTDSSILYEVYLQCGFELPVRPVPVH